MSSKHKTIWDVVSVNGFDAGEIDFNAPALSKGFELIQSAAQTQVYRFVRNGTHYYYKTYTGTTIATTVKDLFRGNWSERVRWIHEQLIRSGIGVPMIACTARCGKVGVSISQEVKGQVLRKEYRSINPDDRVELMKLLGQSIGYLHRKGFSHGDLRWGNIISQSMNGQWEFVYLDNERTRFFKTLPDYYRQKNLVQVRLSGLLNGMPESEWDVFYTNYCSGTQASRKNAIKWESSVKQKTARRISSREKRDKSTPFALSH